MPVGFPTTLQTYIYQVQRLVHDATHSTFGAQEIIDYINEAREDVALDMHCVRTFYTGVQLLPSQETYPLSGAVVGANITAGGNYAAPPAVLFDVAPLGQTTANGVAVLNASGAVTAVNLTNWGSGYNEAPAIRFDPPGAMATSIFFQNVFQIISITNIWNQQRYTLSFRGFTLFQAYFRAWTTQFVSRPGIWTMHPQMLQVMMRPMPDQQYFSEWDVLALPTPLRNSTDQDLQLPLVASKAVQFRAANLALLKDQNFDQAAIMDGIYSQRVPKYIIGTGGYRIPNPYSRSFQRRVSRQ